MEWKVPLADLDYGPEEEQAVLAVLRSRWLTMGSVTQAFENAFTEFSGARHAIAVSNGTVALHLACLALDIGPSDEVIVPSLSFVATANAVLYTGARVRFADVCSPQDLTIDPQSIEQQVNARTRAIIVMHYAGYPCDMLAIVALAKRHNLFIIEDAAHASGAWLNGQHLGTFGEVGCFSFFSNKNLATGEGGMIVTQNDEIAEKVRLLRSHGMTSLTWDRHQGHAYSYDVVDLGYNYRIDEMRAALGIEQLKKLPANNTRRAAITKHYWSAFQDTLTSDSSYGSIRDTADLPQPPLVELPFAHLQRLAATQPACHIFPLLLPLGLNRLALIDHLREAGIQTSIHYPPIHTFQYYRRLCAEELASHSKDSAIAGTGFQSGSSKPTESADLTGYADLTGSAYPAESTGVSLPVTEAVAPRQLTLPLFPGMTDEQVDYVIEKTRQALEKIARN